VTVPRKSRQNLDIRDFILRTIPSHPVAIGSLAAQKFGLSRTAANRYLKRLEAEGFISADGKTSARHYALKPISEHTATVSITPNLYESDVWRLQIEPCLKNVSDNVERLCQYGFTEMFNNVIDHSGSAEAIVSYRQDYADIRMVVIDHGVGIFEKIQKDFHLPDARSALLELSKGKLTSDKAKHSGEGIFFTSRMFNSFTILSGHLCYTRKMTDDWGWLSETEDRAKYVKGTTVVMTLAANATWTPKDVFDKYQNEEWDFAKTHVPVALGKYGQEQLVSRSQAKRILARFDRFEEVLLDFKGIAEIGQAFADEIFRVFALAHPQIKIITLNTTDEVRKMIAHAQAANPSSPKAPH
jgi:anti-sigma regulatory factor (Ser/Thr protein kinase)